MVTIFFQKSSDSFHTDPSREWEKYLYKPDQTFDLDLIYLEQDKNIVRSPVTKK